MSAALSGMRAPATGSTHHAPIRRAGYYCRAWILVLFCLYLGLYHGLFGLLVSLLAGRGTILSRRALLAGPFSWVAVELARTRITGFPGACWASLRSTTFRWRESRTRHRRLRNIVRNHGGEYRDGRRISGSTRQAQAQLVTASLHRSWRICRLAGWSTLPPLPTDHTALLVQQNIPILRRRGLDQGIFRRHTARPDD